MEDRSEERGGLNPCFNGIWSRTNLAIDVSYHRDGLNPCFNGIWSRTFYIITDNSINIVLILVLMEYGLGPFKNHNNNAKHVLILVLMEYGLGRLERGTLPR